MQYSWGAKFFYMKITVSTEIVAKGSLVYSRVTRSEMDTGAKWTYWVLSIILPEIEQSTVVQ